MGTECVAVSDVQVELRVRIVGGEIKEYCGSGGQGGGKRWRKMERWRRK